MKRLLKGGRVVDPVNGIDAVCDVLIEDGRIARIGAGLPVNGAEVVDIPAGLLVCPGFIDMHSHAAGGIDAHITYIAAQAEYTPPVIYSNDTREKLVYMIEARPAVPDAAKLNPGQPVQVSRP